MNLTAYLGKYVACIFLSRRFACIRSRNKVQLIIRRNRRNTVFQLRLGDFEFAKHKPFRRIFRCALSDRYHQLEYLTFQCGRQLVILA